MRLSAFAGAVAMALLALAWGEATNAAPPKGAAAPKQGAAAPKRNSAAAGAAKRTTTSAAKGKPKGKSKKPKAAPEPPPPPPFACEALGWRPQQQHVRVRALEDGRLELIHELELLPTAATATGDGPPRIYLALGAPGLPDSVDVRWLSLRHDGLLHDRGALEAQPVPYQLEPHARGACVLSGSGHETGLVIDARALVRPGAPQVLQVITRSHGGVGKDRARDLLVRPFVWAGRGVPLGAIGAAPLAGGRALCHPLRAERPLRFGQAPATDEALCLSVPTATP